MRLRNSSAKVLHFRSHDANPVGDQVVADQCGNRRSQSRASVDQCFCDTGSNGDDGSRAGRADVVEGDHDAPDGSEQSDERRGCGDGGQDRAVSGQSLQLDSAGSLQRPADSFDRHDLVLRVVGPSLFAQRFHLSIDLDVAGLEHPNQGGGAELSGGGVDLAETSTAAEHVQEMLVLLRDLSEVPELADHDDPGQNRHDDQNEEDDLADRTRLHEGPKNRELRMAGHRRNGQRGS